MRVILFSVIALIICSCENMNTENEWCKKFENHIYLRKPGFTGIYTHDPECYECKRMLYEHKEKL